MLTAIVFLIDPLPSAWRLSVDRLRPTLPNCRIMRAVCGQEFLQCRIQIRRSISTVQSLRREHEPVFRRTSSRFASTKRKWWTAAQPGWHWRAHRQHANRQNDRCSEAHHRWRGGEARQQDGSTEGGSPDQRSGKAGLMAQGRGVIPPFLRGLGRRIYAAIFSFCAGVIPPLPMFGRSWL